MGRADRRKAGIAEKPKTYVMTDAQLKKIKDDAKKEMFLTALCIPILVLHDKFNFTEDQFSDFIASCLTWMKCVDDGEVKMSEIVEECEKFANINIEKKKGKVNDQEKLRRLQDGLRLPAAPTTGFPFR